MVAEALEFVLVSERHSLQAGEMRGGADARLAGLMPGGGLFAERHSLQAGETRGGTDARLAGLMPGGELFDRAIVETRRCVSPEHQCSAGQTLEGTLVHEARQHRLQHELRAAVRAAQGLAVLDRADGVLGK